MLGLTEGSLVADRDGIADVVASRRQAQKKIVFLIPVVIFSWGSLLLVARDGTGEVLLLAP